MKLSAPRLGTKRQYVQRVIRQPKRFVNPLTGNHVLKATYNKALREIERREKVWQETLQKVEKMSHFMEQKVDDHKSSPKLWFPLQKALKKYTKSFEITIINKNDPLIQLNGTMDSVAYILNKQLNEMKGMKYIETLKVTFNKTIVVNNKSKIIFKTAYFNSKAKTIISKNEINENIQTSKQEILNGIEVWLSEGSGWTIESIDKQYINIVKYKPLKGSSYIKLPPELRNPAKGLINLKNNDNECFRWCHIRHLNSQEKNAQRVKKSNKEYIKKLNCTNVSFSVTQKDYRKIEIMNNH